MISSTLRSASAVRPEATNARLSVPSAWMIPNRSSMRRKPASAFSPSDSRLVDVARPEADAGLQVEHHRRPPLVAPAVGFLEYELGKRLGFGVASPEVVDVGEQTARPRDAAAVAELLERLDRRLQPALRLGMVAGEERHPRQVLLHPGPPAQVADLGVDGIGLVEEPLGIAERAAEHFGEPRALSASPRWTWSPISRNSATAWPRSRRAVSRSPSICAAVPRSRSASAWATRSPAASARSSTSASTSRAWTSARGLDQALGHQQQRRLQRDVVGVEAERTIDHLEAAAVGALLIPAGAACTSSVAACSAASCGTPGVGPISATSSAAQAR